MTEEQVKHFIEVALNEHSATAWKEMVAAALSSPVIMFIIAIFLVFLLKKPIASLLVGRSIELRWGNKQIKLSELSNSFDKELDPLKEDIEALKIRLNELQGAQDGALETTVPAEASGDDMQRIRDRMYKALGSPKFRWRTIESLAEFSRATEEQIMELIASDEKVVLGQDKHGNRLAKFKHR